MILQVRLAARILGTLSVVDYSHMKMSGHDGSAVQEADIRRPLSVPPPLINTMQKIVSRDAESFMARWSRGVCHTSLDQVSPCPRGIDRDRRACAHSRSI